MKGLSVAGIMMIATIAFAGVLVLLMGSSGFTPVYYHALPEMQFIELFSSYLQTTKNIERTIREDPERFFRTIKDYPIEWKNWVSSTSFKNDFEDIFSEKLKKMAEEYFSSVSGMGFVVIEVKSVDSYNGVNNEVEYTPPDKLKWNYIYNIHMKRKITGYDLVHKINTNVVIKDLEINFINLNDAYDCANNFFDKLDSKTADTTYTFSKSESSDLKTGLTFKLNEIIDDLSSCDSFDKSFNVKISYDSLCDCKQIKPADIILTLKKPGSELGIAFSYKYNNFQCGQEIRCNNGLDCGTRDCINSYCGTCWSETLGDYCSPSVVGDFYINHDYKCTETDTGEFKCLKIFSNIELYINDQRFNSEVGKKELNCGQLGSAVLEVDGLSKDYYFKYSGVKITDDGTKITNPLDLCDTSKVPRTNSKLKIYVISNTNAYVVDSFDIYFALSSFINQLNQDMSKDPELSECGVYRLYSEPCTSFKENLENQIKKCVGSLDYYDINVSWVEKNNPTTARECAENEEISYMDEYEMIRIDFIEQSTGRKTSLYYAVELEYQRHST
jgi:hypothetical protein